VVSQYPTNVHLILFGSSLIRLQSGMCI
jgi:hypothetical protein